MTIQQDGQRYIQMKIALYKSTRSGMAGLYNRLVRWWDRGVYSHCEVVFSDGMSASSSYLDKGVRFKDITYELDKWDFFDVPDSYEANAREWFEKHKGQGYNLIGNARFAIGFLAPPENKWFCSESIAASLGVPEPWRMSPNGIVAILHVMFNTKLCCDKNK